MTTQDGYILQAIRVVNPLANASVVAKLYNPVLIHHGIFYSAVSYVIQGNNTRPRIPAADTKRGINDTRTEAKEDDLPTSLPFYLSNNLFDVWLLNARGTNYHGTAASSDLAKYHTNKNITSNDYWNFSLDEQALNDIPAFVEHVKNVTKWPKVSYIGHSESTTFMFALLSRRPEFSQNIDKFIAIAPITYLKHTNGPINLVIDYVYPLLHKMNGVFYPSNIADMLAYLQGQVCSVPIIKEIMCRLPYEIELGFDQRETLLVGTTYKSNVANN